jgi:hypothetical protein
VECFASSALNLTTTAHDLIACSRLVVSGTKFVKGQQIVRCKLLDFIFNAMSVSVGVEFYITFLPFLFWIDQVGYLVLVLACKTPA